MFSAIARSCSSSAVARSSFAGLRPLSTSVYEHLNNSVERYPTKNTNRFTEQGVRWSAINLKRYSEAISNGLIGSGLVGGDKVVVVLPHSSEHVATQLGAAFAGLNIVSVSGVPTLENLKKIIDTESPYAVVFDPAFCEKEGLMRDDVHNLSTSSMYCITTGFDNTSEHNVVRYKDFQIFNPSYRYVDIAASRTEGPLLTLLSKEGKRVEEITYQQADEQSDAVASQLKLTADDSFCLSSKTLSPKALLIGAIASIKTSSQFVIPAKKYDASLVQTAVADEECVGSIGDTQVDGLKHFEV